MHIAYVNSEKVKRAPHAQGESMNTSHVQMRTPPLGSGEGPGAIVHPVHPHEDDPHDGAGADPHDERMRGRELIATWLALILASWVFVYAIGYGIWVLLS